MGFAVVILLFVAPAQEPPRAWTDADEATQWAERGGLDVCETLTLPLQLLPTVGTLVAMVLEWGCVPPTTSTVEFVQRFPRHPGRSRVAVHAGRGVGKNLAGPVARGRCGGAADGRGQLWIGGVGDGRGVEAGLCPGGGVLHTGGRGRVTGQLGASSRRRSARKSGADLMFNWTFRALSGELPPEPERTELQRHSPVGPPFTAAERTWLLATTAAGTEPPFRWPYLIPFAGPLLRGREKVGVLRASMRRLSSEDLHEEGRTLVPMDLTIVGLCAAEAGMDLLAQASLALGASVFVLGTISTLAWVRDPRHSRVAGGVTALAGVLGSAAAGLALILLVGRELPRSWNPSSSRRRTA